MAMRKMYTELGHKGTEKQKLYFYFQGQHRCFVEVKKRKKSLGGRCFKGRKL